MFASACHYHVLGSGGDYISIFRQTERRKKQPLFSLKTIIAKPMTALDYIKSKAIAANPEIVELKGCSLNTTGCECYPDRLSREIRLADVLNTVPDNPVEIRLSKPFVLMINHTNKTDVRWDLRESFDNQKPEVHVFIAEVLGWKGESV